MRVLFISSRFPYPPIQGDRLRAYHQIRLLSERHRIILLSPVGCDTTSDDLEAMRAFCEGVHVLPVSTVRRTLRLWRGPFTSLPLQVLFWCDERFASRAAELVRQYRVDLVHVQLLRMAPAVALLKGLPKVIDFSDALSMAFMRRTRFYRFPVNLIARWEARRLHHYEQKLLEEFDAATAISDVDKTALGGKQKIHISRNGVDFSEFQYSEERPREKTIVLAGRMETFPNASAAKWFATEVFPLIRVQERDVRLQIVGGRPRASVRRLARIPGVEVLAMVPKISVYVAQASVAVAPLLTAAGVQNKILEAMACGTPVVSTSISARACGAVDGEHLLVADRAEEFAEKVLALLRDAKFALKIAQRARAFVEHEFSWERAAQELEAAWYDALGNALTKSAMPISEKKRSWQAESYPAIETKA